MSWRLAEAAFSQRVTRMVLLQPPPTPTQAPPVVVVAKPSRPVGSTTLRCVVTVLGALTRCEVASESPAGAGLAESALRLVSRFQVKPAMRDGRPVEGVLLVPFQFQMASDAAPPPSPAARSPGR